MPSASLLVAGAVSVLTGFAFLFVAGQIARRDVATDMRAGNRTLALWWGLLGAYLLLQGGLTTAAAYGALTLDVYLASRALAIPLLCAACASLVHHLVFLYTGDRRRSAWIAFLYAPVFLLFLYATFGQPQTLRVSTWLVGLDDTGAAYRLTYALVGLPPILASLAYLRLLRHVKDPLARFRIRLVALTIAAYVGSGLAARLAADDLTKLVTLVGFGLAAAGLVLLAYNPPRRLRARLQEAGGP